MKTAQFIKMKKLLFTGIPVLLGLLSILPSCKKDYLIGGSIEDVNMYKGMTNYEVLSKDPAFDTLVQLIDAAGLKDQINQGGTTFFAPSDYAILNYMQQRTLYVQEHYNANGIFGLDSLKYYLKNNIDNTRDSMLMYQINTPLPYDVLTRTGIAYQTGLSKDTAIVSYSPYGGTGPVSTQPRAVFYTHLWYHYDLSNSNRAEDIPEEIGVRTLVITSGINTKSGIMNYLENFHILFFYGTKQ